MTEAKVLGTPCPFPQVKLFGMYPSFCWNTDVMAGAVAAILQHEDKSWPCLPTSNLLYVKKQIIQFGSILLGQASTSVADTYPDFFLA